MQRSYLFLFSLYLADESAHVMTQTADEMDSKCIPNSLTVIIHFSSRNGN